MRKLILAAIVLVLVGYVVLVFRRGPTFAVPGYETVAVALEAPGSGPEAQAAFEERLLALDTRRLQPAETLSAGGETFPPEKALRREDYRALLEAGRIDLTLRDPAAIKAFADRRLHLRQDVVRDGETLAEAGALLDKDLLDRLNAAGVERIGVVGKGDVVGFNATALMVILIFIGLLLALDAIFWQPVMAIVDKRRREVAEGQKLVRRNREREGEIEDERREHLRAISKGYQETLRKTRQGTLEEAEKIVDEAWQEMKTMRDARILELREVHREAEEELNRKLPEFAETVVGKVTASKEPRS